jgi:hypothetical protein
MPPTAEATTEAAPELDMLQVAAEADAAASVTTAPEKSEAAAPATAPQETTGLPAATGKDAKKPDAPAAPDAARQTGDAKPDAKAKKETPFEKAKQDADRRDRSWKALEEEKAKGKREQEQQQRKEVESTSSSREGRWSSQQQWELPGRTRSGCITAHLCLGQGTEGKQWRFLLWSAWAVKRSQS